MPTNWADPSYLQSGTSRQQAAYALLDALGVFRHLRPYSPLLVGTIPLNIDTPQSDLDAFERDVSAAPPSLPGQRSG
jgi:hypothetical protein